MASRAPCSRVWLATYTEEEMAKTVKDLLAEANTTVPKLSPAEAYTAVFNIGGFKDLAEAGVDTEPP